ncbi:MAG: hypothetical protein BWY63_03253 [Chloroflexi bacterium ADurb.Bin360]|nr:MAG: hypothetical protein BWY63_03253 [Chloroflexi bacterium ADurb.Bin360]
MRFETPFRYLGGDDGAVFQALTSNDSSSAWLLDPSACESGDTFCLDAANQLTPGALNPGQRPFPWVILALLIVIASLLLGALLLLEARRRARR